MEKKIEDKIVRLKPETQVEFASLQRLEEAARDEDLTADQFINILLANWKIGHGKI